LTKAEHFREFAEEAMQRSRQSGTDAKKLLIDLIHLDASCGLKRAECGGPAGAKGLTHEWRAELFGIVDPISGLKA
jgi:hypothetical protein